jgi:galactose mutarotase-like enzyme
VLLSKRKKRVFDFFSQKNQKTPPFSANQSTEVSNSLSRYQIYSGKHGYSVDVQTDNDGIYVASVTIPNVGEDRFAEGWFAKSGEPTGWIGGAEIPIIRCK